MSTPPMGVPDNNKTLSDLKAELDEDDAYLAKRIALDHARDEYLQKLRAATGGNENLTWQEAHIAAFGETVEQTRARTGRP